MKNSLKPILALAIIVASLAPTKNYAQDATAALITAAGGAGGYAIGKAFEDQWEWAPAVGAAVLPAVANWGYGVFKKKSDEDKIKYYISGRNYERWMQSQATWYQSTLNPYTGRPQAFTGLNEMDAGIQADQGQGQENPGIDRLYTVPVKLPAGTYEGVPYTERIGEFPKLP